MNTREKLKGLIIKVSKRKISLYLDFEKRRERERKSIKKKKNIFLTKKLLHGEKLYRYTLGEGFSFLLGANIVSQVTECIA